MPGTTRLSLTLKFRATIYSFASLMFQFNVSKAYICSIRREVCEALVKALEHYVEQQSTLTVVSANLKVSLHFLVSSPSIMNRSGSYKNQDDFGTSSAAEPLFFFDTSEPYKQQQRMNEQIGSANAIEAIRSAEGARVLHVVPRLRWGATCPCALRPVGAIRGMHLLAPLHAPSCNHVQQAHASKAYRKLHRCKRPLGNLVRCYTKEPAKV
ncbi:hypothetical protein PR048_001551 [Dryococelus australis]|uniref:Uncharacterized protein n=1 Tax=Dryococelus australis TaxID=614101 RepID=A0ABQ9IHP2_9NEOP|nr:hypothetical protein PR048_001551 [Dryococelus australis]